MTPLEVRLQQAEAAVEGLRDDCGKRIIWAGEPGARTPLVVVYVHGFSASPMELTPVPERIAAALGANLFMTRLAGHGIDGAAMARATLEAWRDDVREACDVAAQIGGRVLWMGCSTGGTLITLGLSDGMAGEGVIFVSPNFGLIRPGQWLLDAPGVRNWAPKVIGGARSFPTMNEEHARYWTRRYPIEAVFPMSDAVNAVRGVDLSRIRVPALFFYSRGDLVVSPTTTESVIARWGGRTQTCRIRCGHGDDPNSHVITGDILSPGQTERVVNCALDWAAAEQFAPA
ncbi:hypothetical protein OG2516_05853 [Oceanicola granulosus HTCC2516]|uniref:AB hydrolase-1 domain-containing protein n=1 Tax=Oceanicola granulosus (strain ATCC BAA-861 / DSM 15982 / KCTC 12143 / HTCC2516) TaxID=314256 RepID=Q2CII1_OCEGH|nr:alpha/beta fold hydrolase [Oceanicola granulosus]EAR52608.1 hypothetical protein OG2516_05853 [Oceanicola granulosus HTCC2516]